eukprot:867019-Pleurochrysis_carterae.AAC.1
MSDINNSGGIEQADNAVRALERPRRHTDLNIKKEEELALRQMISGIIPEWHEADDKKKKGVMAMLRSWTGEMMNHARIQMKTWIAIKTNIKPKYSTDGITGQKCVGHSRTGERGLGMYMKQGRGI